MRLHLLLTAAALACLTGFLPATRAGDPTASFNLRRTPVVDVVKRTKGAVVNIHSERSSGTADSHADGLGTTPNRVNGMGTGIIIDPRGYVVTNHHVIEDVNLLRVRLADGTSTTARVVARDPESDLALLKIDVNRPLPTITLGTSQDVMVGETVIAIGNAYGYEHTVTVGVVSATKRDVALNKEMSYKALIQTDASINPGNSGGPLLNVNGELIGVNVAIRAGAQGIGFAIPVDSMLQVAADMMSVRKRNGTWHGLVGRDDVVLPSEEGDVPVKRVKDEVEAKAQRRLVVERAEAGSPAAAAGLQRGDVVVKVSGQAVICALDLERALLDRQAGDKVPVVVRRKDGEQKLELVLAPVDRAGAVGGDLIWRKLGVKMQAVSPEVVSHVNQQLHGGLAVTDVRDESVAARAGIQKGDILVGLHSWEMLSLDNVLFVLNHNDLASFNPLRFYIIRAGQVHRGWMQQVE
ncbi:MAG TPA: trypsin-like peptidase domain-containing protein [Gemmataceae bacterium]|nr:trypsin-like peptidase domain-containing protein [Gemmataceae bacterium]